MSAAVGFRAPYPLAYRIYNVLFAALLFVAVSPLFVAISALLFLTQGPSIFYRGQRIGKDKTPFNIIKFRTLCPHRALQVTADRTLPADANIETPLGAVLRETRLDEIPQLLNIIRGDMNICGPRPVRSGIAAIESMRVESYDIRFEVRPGLIGPAQALFGHSASKRLRARMNNAAARRNVNMWAELSLLARIGMSIVERIAGKVTKRIRTLANGEVPAPRQNIWVVNPEQGDEVLVDRIDLSELAVRSVDAVSEKPQIEVRLASGGVRRARVRLVPSARSGSFGYEPLDEISAFVIERYALGRVVIPPRLARSVQGNKRGADLIGEVAGA